MFQGWDGYRACPVPPLLVCICRYPQSREFPLHHYCGSGTRTIPYKKISSNLSCKFSDTEKKEAGPHCLCAARWNNVTTVRVTMTNHLCLMHPHTTTMCNYILYTKARYLEKQKHSWNEDSCAISREKWYCTNWPTKYVKQDRQDNGNCEHIKLKPIIITQARLQLAAGESYSVNHVRFLYFCRALGHLISQPLGK